MLAFYTHRNLDSSNEIVALNVFKRKKKRLLKGVC